MGNVFVVGDLNVDMLLYVKGLPSNGEERYAERINFSIGGNAANFAVALGRIGARPEFYSCMGDDFSSPYLRRQLEDAGVSLILKEVPGANGYTTAFVLPNGERTMVSNKGASGELVVRDLEPLLEKIRPGDIVYVGGLFHLPKLTKGFGGFLKSARERGATTMFDFTFDCRGCSDSFRGFAEHLDMVFLNEGETKRLGKGDLKESLKRISGMGIKNIITKLGARGAVFFTNGMLKKQPGERINVVDSTGAGDVFNAGFVYGFMSGLNSDQCLRLGNMVGAWKVSHSGISVPPRDSVADFIKDFHND